MNMDIGWVVTLWSGLVAASRVVVRFIRTDEELMMTSSEWQIERTAIEMKVPLRAELAIEGATA